MVSLGSLGELDVHHQWMVVLLITVASSVSLISALVYCACLNRLMMNFTKSAAKPTMNYNTMNKGAKQQKLAVQPSGSSPATGSKSSYPVQPAKTTAKTAHKKKTKDKSDDLGRLQLHIAYFPSRMALEVTIVCAKGLPAKDVSGTSDPYCRVMLLPAHEKKINTKVKNKTLGPVWNETIPFAVSRMELNEQTLYIYILDHDMINQDDMIGECRILLRQLNLNRGQYIWCNVMPTLGYATHLGEVLLSLCYTPSHEKLTVNILKATNLKAMDANNSSDPYVKIWLMHNGQKIEKRKTKTKMKNLNPIYNEQFTFSISLTKVHSYHLLVEVIDYDKMSKNDTIGMVYLGDKGRGSEAHHWKEMCERMQQPIAQWHRLRDDVETI